MTAKVRGALGVLVFLAAVAGTAASVFYFRQASDLKAEIAALEQAGNELEQRAAAVARGEEPRVAAGGINTEDAGVVTADTTVTEYEARLAAKNEELAGLYDRVARLEEAARTNRPPERRDRRSWMDELRENDPERYAEITERRQQAREAAKYEVARKAAYFLDRDTSSMSEAEAEAYEEMMLLLTETLALTERLGAELPWEERRPLMSEFRNNLRNLSPMLEQEREYEFFQIGKDMGYTDDDAAAFADYLTEVVEVTSVGSIFRSSMRAMRGEWGGRTDDGEER